jgi:hypothetical protein
MNESSNIYASDKDHQRATIGLLVLCPIIFLGSVDAWGTSPCYSIFTNGYASDPLLFIPIFNLIFLLPYCAFCLWRSIKHEISLQKYRWQLYLVSILPISMLGYLSIFFFLRELRQHVFDTKRYDDINAYSYECIMNGHMNYEPRYFIWWGIFIILSALAIFCMIAPGRIEKDRFSD